MIALSLMACCYTPHSKFWDLVHFSSATLSFHQRYHNQKMRKVESLGKFEREEGGGRREGGEPEIK